MFVCHQKQKANNSSQEGGGNLILKQGSFFVNTRRRIKWDRLAGSDPPLPLHHHQPKTVKS